MKNRFYKILLSATIFFSSFANAQDTTTRLGRETNLPIPRFVSIKGDEAFMRKGPSSEYEIKWVYGLKGLPLVVTAESGHWRKVEDFEGETGWLHYVLLSGNRTALITEERVSLNKTPSQNAQLVAILEQNVVANLLACELEWCLIEADGYEGWLPKSSFWGASSEEVFKE